MNERDSNELLGLEATFEMQEDQALFQRWHFNNIRINNFIVDIDKICKESLADKWKVNYAKDTVKRINQLNSENFLLFIQRNFKQEGFEEIEKPNCLIFLDLGYTNDDIINEVLDVLKNSFPEMPKKLESFLLDYKDFFESGLCSNDDIDTLQTFLMKYVTLILLSVKIEK